MLLELIALNNHKYFLGGASPNGFTTRFGKQIADTDYSTYIIKGGPGTGKSSLMKKLADAFPDEDKDIYYCSADPNSLDSVVFKKSKVIFVDGTAPHIFDAEYPGAVQTILNLGEYWDIGLLKSHKKEIIGITKDYLQYHLRCKRFITAMSAVTADTIHITSSALNLDKLDGFITRLSKKLFSKSDEGNLGKTEFKQISALTPNGYLTFIPDNCEIYLLNDPFYSGSDMFLRKFAEIITQKCFDVIISECTLHSNNFFEHIYIPDLNLVFISANLINDITVSGKKIINFTRFYDKNILREKKARLKFNKKAVNDLKDEAIECLVNAKKVHDKLERYYITATDFDGINRLIYKLISQIKSNT